MVSNNFRKAVKKVILSEAESKFHYTALAVDYPQWHEIKQIYPLPQIVQGDLVSERNGDQIFLQSIKFRFTCRNEEINCRCIWRVLWVTDRTPNATGPGINIFREQNNAGPYTDFNNADVSHPAWLLTPINRDRYIVHKDWKFSLGVRRTTYESSIVGGEPFRCVERRCRMNKKIDYEGSASGTTPVMKLIYWCEKSNPQGLNADNVPHIGIQTWLYYKDI